MVQIEKRRRPVFMMVLGLVAAMTLGACSGGGSQRPTPVAGSSPTPSGMPVAQAEPPKVCELTQINAEACNTAVAVERALTIGDVSGFDIADEVKAALDLVLGREEDLHVTAIGCPFAATALGCGPSFGIAVSSVAPGTDARAAKGITYALTLARIRPRRHGRHRDAEARPAAESRGGERAADGGDTQVFFTSEHEV